MQFTQPNSDSFIEMNDCHSPADGKFCSGSGSRAATGRRADISAEWRQSMARAGLRTDRPGTQTHRGFTIRQQDDGIFIASHPKFKAARPSGVTLGDVKTQINMFQTGVRNAGARKLRASPHVLHDAQGNIFSTHATKREAVAQRRTLRAAGKLVFIRPKGR